MTTKPQSHNLRLYSERVKWFIPEISELDLKFVCNKSASLYRRLDRAVGCVDNFRVMQSNTKEANQRYRDALASGCCGSTDLDYTNPYTKNTFTIGFNYGH